MVWLPFSGHIGPILWKLPHVGWRTRCHKQINHAASQDLPPAHSFPSMQVHHLSILVATLIEQHERHYGGESPKSYLLCDDVIVLDAPTLSQSRNMAPLGEPELSTVMARRTTTYHDFRNSTRMILRVAQSLRF